MEWTQKVLFHGLLKPDFVCDLVIKQLIYIFADDVVIPLIRRSRHTKKQLRLKVCHNLLVCICRAMVRFIQYDAVEFIRCKPAKILLFMKRLHHSKDIIRVIVSMPGADYPKCILTVKYTFKRIPRLFGQRISVNDKEHSFEAQLPHRKCRCICFSGTGCRYKQCPVFSHTNQLPEIRNKPNLHAVRR